MNGPTADKQSLLCECISSKKTNEDIVSLEFCWTGPSPRAGQFFLVKPKRTQVFLARPFSIASWKSGGRQDAAVRFIIQKQGRGSEELLDFHPGEKAELIGPLGNTWASFGVPDRDIALVSGGVGLAPLAFFVQELAEGGKEFDFYAGFKGSPYGLEDVKARSLVIAAEDGLTGQKGRVLEFFSPDNYKAVFGCGPLPMLRALAGICKKSGIPCFVSMEKRMACGTGACLGCTIKTKNGNKRCCADGPVFNALELNFE